MIHFRIEFEVEFEFGAILIVCRRQSKLSEQVFYGLLRLSKLHFNVCRSGVVYALPMITFYIVGIFVGMLSLYQEALLKCSWSKLWYFDVV